MNPGQREDIKAGLRKRGYTLAGVAQELGVSRQAVSLILAGRRSQRIEAYIAQVLGLTVAEVWTGRYPSDKESV